MLKIDECTKWKTVLLSLVFHFYNFPAKKPAAAASIARLLQIGSSCLCIVGRHGNKYSMIQIQYVDIWKIEEACMESLLRLYFVYSSPIPDI